MAARARKTAPYRRIPSYYDFATTGFREAQLQDLDDFPITRYPHQPLLSRIWELQRNVTA